MSGGAPDGSSTGSRQGDRSSFFRRNAVSILIVAVLTVVGAMIAPFIASDLPWWRATLGGALLGAFGGFATVLNRLLLGGEL